jgi:hypothetical protein
MSGTNRPPRDAWPKDYLTQPAQLLGKKLFLSTITAESRTDAGQNKTCLFCGLTYYYRPSNCEVHLDVSLTKETMGKARAVQECNPYGEHQDRFQEILKEVTGRRKATTAEAAASLKRGLEQMGGEAFPVDVDLLPDSRGGARGGRISGRKPGGGKAPASSPFKPPVTLQEMNNQWTRALVSAGLPLRFFDNKEVRKAVLMTAQCGPNCISTSPGGKKTTSLPHRTYVTTRLIPTLDKTLDDKNMAKMAKMLEDLGGMILSDGWQSTSHHPIVNVILGARSFFSLRAAVDTMGEDKTMDFIADLIVQHIREIGPEKIVAVCMDGACKGAFDKIRAVFPWIQCFVCPGHGKP